MTCILMLCVYLREFVCDCVTCTLMLCLYLCKLCVTCTLMLCVYLCEFVCDVFTDDVCIFV